MPPGGTSQFYLLSVADVETLSKGLGDKARGITVTQTAPSPWNSTIPVVKEYQSAMQAIGKKEFDYVSFQGFLSAKLMVEAIRATGKTVTRERLIEALEQFRKKDLGGFTVNFSPELHHGSTYVDITMISKNGRFIL